MFTKNRAARGTEKIGDFFEKITPRKIKSAVCTETKTGFLKIDFRVLFFSFQLEKTTTGLLLQRRVSTLNFRQRRDSGAQAHRVRNRRRRGEGSGELLMILMFEITVC